MDSQNPYQSPKETALSLDHFDPARLPLVFRIRVGWGGFWVGLLVVGAIGLLIQLKTLWFATANSPGRYLGYAVLIPFLPLPCVCVLALCSRIEISRVGIRSHLFGRTVPWADIRSWTKNGKSKITLTLVDGKQQSIVNPATSELRIGIIADALTHFVGKSTV